MYGMSEDQILSDEQAAALIYNLIMRHSQAHTPVEEIALFKAIAVLDWCLYEVVTTPSDDECPDNDEDEDEFDEEPEDETTI